MSAACHGGYEAAVVLNSRVNGVWESWPNAAWPVSRCDAGSGSFYRPICGGCRGGGRASKRRRFLLDGASLRAITWQPWKTARETGSVAERPLSLSFLPPVLHPSVGLSPLSIIASLMSVLSFNLCVSRPPRLLSTPVCPHHHPLSSLYSLFLRSRRIFNHFFLYCPALLCGSVSVSPINTRNGFTHNALTPFTVTMSRL